MGGGAVFDVDNQLLMMILLSVSFVFAGIGIFFFVSSGIVWASFEKLLQAGDYSKVKKESICHGSHLCFLLANYHRNIPSITHVKYPSVSLRMIVRECMAKTGGVPGYIEDFYHVLSENQASKTDWYLAWVILGYSLATNQWEYSWVIWVVAGVVFPAIVMIANLLVQKVFPLMRQDLLNR